MMSEEVPGSRQNGQGEEAQSWLTLASLCLHEVRHFLNIYREGKNV